MSINQKLRIIQVICLLGEQVMSVRKINAHWRRKQAEIVSRRAKNRFFRFRILRGHNTAQILLRANKGNRATERLRKKALLNKIVMTIII